MEDSNVTVLSLIARLTVTVSDARDCGLGPDDINTALAAVQQLVSLVGPAEQKKTVSQPGAAPRK